MRAKKLDTFQLCTYNGAGRYKNKTKHLKKLSDERSEKTLDKSSSYYYWRARAKILGKSVA